MKSFFNIIWISSFVFSITSCSEDRMDEINKNLNDPTDVTSDLIIPDLITSTAFSLVGSDLAFYASVYVEHNVGVWGQMYDAEIRSVQPTSSTTYNNSWDSFYRNLSNLKIVINKCSADGSEKGNYHSLGIAQTLTAYNLALLTDLMGDVPWTEALQPGVIFAPKLDSQESIYNTVFNLLDEAIVNFQKETLYTPLDGNDFIYKGDVDKWIKFAYGLKARYALRLSLRSPKYDEVLEFASKSFDSIEDEAKFKYNGESAVSPFYRFFLNRDGFGASQSLADKLEERNDPRLEKFFKQHPKSSEFVFAPNGDNDQVNEYYAISALSDATAPTFLLSYHEIEFVKAEAYIRKNKLAEAKESLKNAIIGAFQKVNVGLTQEQAETYFNTEVSAKFDVNPIQEIMIQKYIAFFEEEAVEAYNDIRRLKAMGYNVIKLSNSRSVSQFPLRFTYGSSDVTTNLNVSRAYGNGNYVYTDNVWWAGGNR